MIYSKTEWENAYRMWKAIDSPYLRGISKPITPECVPVISRIDEKRIQTLDWIDNETLKHRKESFKTIPYEVVMYFNEIAPKGVLLTAAMLMYAQSEEEVAAIWIAGICKNICLLKDYSSPLYCNALSFYNSAVGFLRDRFVIWHHACKRFVPDINTQFEDYYDETYEDKQEVMNFIFKNILELKKEYTIVDYTTLDEEEAELERKKSKRYYCKDIS